MKQLFTDHNLCTYQYSPTTTYLLIKESYILKGIFYAVNLLIEGSILIGHGLTLVRQE